MYSFFVFLERKLIEYKVYGYLNEPLSAEELFVFISTFFYCFSMGAIFLDMGPFPEDNLAEIVQKENDYDVYATLGCVTCEPLAVKLCKKKTILSYNRWG